ncbi:MAG: hypothetical protein K1X57_10080 [Gemmataceae bacterium]|nr:hypothetical protein [Gemmataceae bacterium]
MAFPRLRVLTRRVLFAFALALVGLAAFFGWAVYQSRAELRAAMAEAAQDDPHWQLADLIAHRLKVPGAENSAPVILEGAKLAKLAAAGTAKSLDGDLLSTLGEAPNVLANSDQKAQLATVVAGYGPAIAEYRKLRDRPIGRFDLKVPANPAMALLPHVQDTRDSLRVLRAAMQERIEAGDTAQAVNDVIAMFHAGRALGDEPTLISMLVRIACDAVAVAAAERLLATTTPTDDQLKALQELIAIEIDEPVAYWGVRGERGFEFAMFDYLRGDPLAAGGVTGGGWQSVLCFLPGYIRHAQVEFLKQSNEYVAIARGPVENRLEATKQIDERAKSLSPLAKSAGFSTGKCIRQELRRQAKLRSLLLAIAAERYRLKHGRWPTVLSALVAEGLLPLLPADPYNGKLLTWEETPYGRVVYSVGEPLPTAGMATSTPAELMKGRDFGIRLFDPDKRRQPAPPPPKAE